MLRRLAFSLSQLFESTSIDKSISTSEVEGFTLTYKTTYITNTKAIMKKDQNLNYIYIKEIVVQEA